MNAHSSNFPSVKFPLLTGSKKEWSTCIEGCPWCKRVEKGFDPNSESVTIHLGAMLCYDEPRMLGKMEIEGGDDEKMTAYLTIDWQSPCGPEKFNYEPDHKNVLVPIAENVRRGQGRLEFCSIDCLESFFCTYH